LALYHDSRQVPMIMATVKTLPVQMANWREPRKRAVFQNHGAVSARGLGEVAAFGVCFETTGDDTVSRGAVDALRELRGPRHGVATAGVEQVGRAGLRVRSRLTTYWIEEPTKKSSRVNPSGSSCYP
jgi:hypothetical protein